MQRKAIISVILNYISEHLFIPPRNWANDEIEKRLGARWAASEILAAYETYESLNILDFIDEFRESFGTNLYFQGAIEATEDIELMLV